MLSSFLNIFGADSEGANTDTEEGFEDAYAKAEAELLAKKEKETPKENSEVKIFDG